MIPAEGDPVQPGITGLYGKLLPSMWADESHQ